MNQCSLCDSQAQVRDRGGDLDVTCPLCGSFFITEELLDLLQSRLRNARHILSGFTRTSHESGSRQFLNTKNVDAILGSPLVPRDPLDQMDCILLYMHRKSDQAGAPLRFTASDCPIAYAKTSSELEYLLDQMVALGYIERIGQPGSGLLIAGFHRISTNGWKRLRSIKERLPDSRQAFVAMWFADEMTSFWEEGFKPALEATRYEALRIDLLEHNDKICDRILVEIRKSRMLVADFTGSRAGVYFEAGFALGLGIPVIWTCRQDHVSQLHFDTRQYNHLLYDTPAELKGKLADRIGALFPGPRKAD